MKAKEKAKELVNKFANQRIDFPYTDTADGRCIGSWYMTFNSAKQCALIAVDEIDEIYQKLTPKDDPYYFLLELEYWQEVKQEIEKYG